MKIKEKLRLLVNFFSPYNIGPANRRYTADPTDPEVIKRVLQENKVVNDYKMSKEYTIFKSIRFMVIVFWTMPGCLYVAYRVYIAF